MRIGVAPGETVRCARVQHPPARTHALHTHTTLSHAPNTARANDGELGRLRRLKYLTLRRGFPRYPSAPLYYPRRIICILLASGAIGHINYDNSEGRPQPGVCDPGTVVARRYTRAEALVPLNGQLRPV